MKESLMKSLFIAFFFLFLTTPYAFDTQAQDSKNQGTGTVQSQPQKKDQSLRKDYEAYSLGELYVTGDKIPASQEVTEYTEITAEQIEATNSKTVAEALTYVPGIRVSTGRKNEPNVMIHGFDQSRALILIDGVPYYETTYGKLDLNVLPVDNIAKIEIQKGVSSVLYGPNAIAGVINIVTKKAGDKPAVDATVETGDYRGHRVSVSHGMKVKKLNYWLNYSHEESKGWYMSDDFDPRLGQIRYRSPNSTVWRILENGNVRDNSATRTNALWAKVGVEPTPASEYYLNFHYIERYKEAPAPIGSVLTNTVFLGPPASVFSQFAQMPKYDNWGIDLSGQQKLSDRVTMKAKLFYHYHVDDYVSYRDETYNSRVADYAVSRYKDDTFGGSLLSDIKLASIDTLRFAFQYRRDSHKERDVTFLPFDQSVSYTGSLGLENELNLIKNFTVVTGVGYDWFEVTKAESNQTKLATPSDKEKFNPMIGATYTFTDGTKVFGSAARKVRFPTLQQLYSSSGNPDLKPEKSLNYVLGVSRGLTRYAQAELSFFCYDVDDFITRDVPTIDGKYDNVGEVLMLGFELSGEVSPTRDLSFRAGYTYNDATDRSPGRVTDRVRNVPTHKVDLAMKYLVPVIGVKLDLTGLYVGKTWGQLPTSSRPNDPAIETDSYLLLNCRIAKVLWKNVEAYFAVNNVFDKDYEPEIDFPAPGRNMFVGLKASY